MKVSGCPPAKGWISGKNATVGKFGGVTDPHTGMDGTQVARLGTQSPRGTAAPPQATSYSFRGVLIDKHPKGGPVTLGHDAHDTSRHHAYSGHSAKAELLRLLPSQGPQQNRKQRLG